MQEKLYSMKKELAELLGRDRLLKSAVKEVNKLDMIKASMVIRNPHHETIDIDRILVYEMRIKKDDTVIVLTGKDKGKTGKVLKAMPKDGKVIVEGVNIQTKHQKQTQKEAAEIKHQEGPIDVSNVMYYDAKTKAPTRIGYKVENGKKVRVSKKTGAVID